MFTTVAQLAQVSLIKKDIVNMWRSSCRVTPLAVNRRSFERPVVFRFLGSAPPFDDEEKTRSKSHPPLMKVAELFPGVAAAGAVAGAGHAGADLLGGAMLAAQGLTGSSPLSAIPVSIILGIGLANTVGVPGHLKLGLTFCSTTLLRAGIVTVKQKGGRGAPLGSPPMLLFLLRQLGALALFWGLNKAYLRAPPRFQVGLKLSLLDVLALGATGVPVVVRLPS